MMTPAGAAKNRDRLLAKNPNFYKEIGKKGGEATRDNGRNPFMEDPGYAAEMGRKSYDDYAPGGVL